MDESAEAISILIADDHRILRQGLRVLLETERGFHVVGEACDGEEAIKLVRELKPDILLLDFRIPRRPGLEALRELARSSIPVRTIILAAEVDRAEIVEAIQLGARGVVLKDSASQVLVDCICSVMAGRYWIGKEKVSDNVYRGTTSHGESSTPLNPAPINGTTIRTEMCRQERRTTMW